MSKSILYIGTLEPSSNSLRRFKTLKKMGYRMRGINSFPILYKSPFVDFHHHLNAGPGIVELNKKVINTINEDIPDIVWVDNKSFLQSRALKKIRNSCPQIKIVNLITDDPTGKYKYAWRLSLKNASYFDIHFVQRKINIAELKKHGAKRVEICYRSYDPELHRPIILNEREREKYASQVGFIGTYEIYREEFIVHLIKNNIPVNITGNEWVKAKQWEIIKPYYKGPSVYGEDYVKTINGFDIALHFLRHVNRDEQDSRTFEIPACGSFMLGERSDVHASLFTEGKEAVFFETKEDLLQKVHYYLEHTEKRKAIAKAGYERCITSGYFHEARLGEVLSKIMA